MKRLSVNELSVGMTAGEDVYNANAQMVLPRGMRLNEKAIEKLEYYGCSSILVAEELQVENAAAEKIQRTVRPNYAYLKFKEDYADAIKGFERNINMLVLKSKDLSLEELIPPAMEHILKVNTGMAILEMLSRVQRFDDGIYVHSVNVGLVSNLLARWVGMNEDDILKATACGLMHDVGKMLVPNELVKKNAELSPQEYEKMKQHTVLGYHFLQNRAFPKCVKNTVLMHHERYDGSGYPVGLKGAQIDPFASIVAIADVYEAQTSDNGYHVADMPFTAFAQMWGETLLQFHPDYLMTFIKNGTESFVQSQVELNNGRIGEIVWVDNLNPAKLIVACQGIFIELNADTTVQIAKII